MEFCSADVRDLK